MPEQTEQEIREKIARELEAEGNEYEKQYGRRDRFHPGAVTAGVYMEAARLVREGPVP